MTAALTRPKQAPEYAVMQTHTIAGARILDHSGTDILQMAKEIALTHHENWDGSGYPNQLRGEQIPIAGRIVAVADVCDALTHRRSYKRAWTITKAISEITTHSGTQFDPRVVAAFTSLDHRDYHHIAAADEPRANLGHITPAA